MSDYIQIDIEFESEAVKDVFIALLTDIGFEGFEEAKNILKAFIPGPAFNEILLKKLMEQYHAIYSTKIIKQRNWNEAWEAGFTPVIIDDFCAIRAEFHKPIYGVAHEIIITPKMSFGTGHHGTTSMMIEAMKRIDGKGKSFFDFGTGTGVLAILAEKMGAAIVEAIDIDDWSIENGKENLQKNSCAKVNLYKSDSILSTARFDIILANINKNIILRNLSSVRKHLLPDGVIIISGLLSGDLDAIAGAALEQKLEILSLQERQGWICLQLGNSPKIS